MAHSLSTIPVEVTAVAECDGEAAFTTIAPIDLTAIFTGHGPLPAVVNTTDQTGDWDAVGETRTVHLADGSRATENLTLYEAPHTFGYTVSDFSGSLRLLARQANGQWWFEPADSSKSDGETSIRWRYEFIPTSVAAFPILWLIARLLWRGYMTNALRLAIEEAERGQSDHR